MAGQTITRTRLYNKLHPWSTWTNGVLMDTGDASDGLADSLVRQTTTSYHSGKVVADAENKQDRDKRETGLLSGGIAASTLSKLRAERNSEPRSRYDNGHPFSTSRTYFVLGGPYTAERTVTGSSTVNHYRSTSYVRVTRSGTAWVNSTFPSLPSRDLTWYGTEAIKRCKPTNSAADLAVAFAELKREGLPHLPGKDLLENWNRRPSVRDGGSETLNIEFGFKPLIAEAVKALDAADRARAILKQYTRDSGRMVRRRYEFPTEQGGTEWSDELSRGTVSFSGHGSTAPWVGTTALTTNGKLNEYHLWKERIWFSGQFTYFIPEADNLLGKLDRYSRMIDALIGSRLSFEAIWNLLPWSWLADWNLNIGSLVANLEDFQDHGILLRYGYVMRHYRGSYIRSVTGPSLRSGVQGPFTAEFIRESKQRARADPFGFSTNPNSYSDRQWNILGALGMTKAHRSL